MDFLLESYALDHPDQMKFTRHNEDGEVADTVNTMIEWEKRLSGKEKQELVKKVSFELPLQYQTPKPPQRFTPSVIK